MIEATKEFFTRYVDFKGRTSRKNFWLGFLGVLLIAFVVGFCAGIVGAAVGSDSISNIIGGIYELAIIVPLIALCIRRLHDINKSGWWYLIGLVPIVGSIILLVFYCMPAVNEGNNY